MSVSCKPLNQKGKKKVLGRKSRIRFVEDGTLFFELCSHIGIERRADKDGTRDSRPLEIGPT
jgi:hypothetical protein